MTLELVDQLMGTLNDEGVGYCHWKSNLVLSHALLGYGDLDLFVGREAVPQALAILMRLGFKPAHIRRGPGTPGISHYYGFDSQTGQLVHIHLFTRVLTGESYVKSHLLPFEGMLSEQTTYTGQVRVAAKPAELVLFVLRTFIKYGSLLDLMRLSGKSEEIRAELRWLQAGTDQSEALHLLREHCPVVDERLFLTCIDALDGNTSLIRRVLLAQRIRRRLRMHTKYTALDRVWAYIHLLWDKLMERLGGSKQKKVLAMGGAVIAFVGPEATGKSTLVSACGRWLGQAFAVRTIHAGRPPSSWLTAPVNVGLSLMRHLLPWVRTVHHQGPLSIALIPQTETRVEGQPSLPYALRAVTLAWDRRQLLTRARRASANGEIVICDRYPSEEVGVMDSPRLRENGTGRGTAWSVHNWLARLEHRLYAQIPPPDIVLRLRASIETAQRRNRQRLKAGNETDAYVEYRHLHGGEWHRSGTKCVYDVDTERSLEETLRVAKTLIWTQL